MCGITGAIDFSSQSLMEIIERMGERLTHRGPDHGGVWGDRKAGIALGHRRLAVLDLSPAGHQPMASVCGRYFLVFNGEIYNAEALRKILDDNALSAIPWRGHSDTEVLLAAVSCWGVESTLPRLTGMFSFALWDRQERVLTLARDRLGEKPLYYARLGNIFLFASELKAFTAHPGWRGEIDPEALTLFFRYGYVPAPYSIFQNCRKLLPGSLLTVRSAEGRIGPLSSCRYWSVEGAAIRGKREPFQGSEQEAVDALEDLLRSAVRQQMVADVPLGAFLSGGIDSSTIVSLLQEESPRPVRTFTIGFSVADYDESAHARRVAQHLGTDHTEMMATPENALAVIPTLPTLFDEPFADASQIPTFLVSRLTRQHVTVSLSGDGGDELFGGYNRYRLAETIWKRLGWIPAGGRQLLARGLRSCPSLLAGRGGGWLGPVFDRFGRRGPFADKMHKLADLVTEPDAEGLYLNLISLWRDPLSLVPGAPSSDLRPKMKGDGALSFPERMMLLDMTRYLPDDILAKVDRAAMGVSLETRIPLLDHRIVEFSWRLPLNLKIRGGTGKWILREVGHRRLPPEFFARPKRGFAVPLDRWLRGPLRDWAEDLLAEERLRREGVLDPGPIRERWSSHLSGERQYQNPLWAVLMFQAWQAFWRRDGGESHPAVAPHASQPSAFFGSGHG